MATAIRKPKYVTIPSAAPAGSETPNTGRPRRPASRPEITYLVREPPTVFPYDDAMIHYSIKGDHHEGIYKGGVFYGFGVSYPETGKIRIAPGYGSVWGRQFELESAHDIDMTALTGIKYCVVYVEISLKSATNQKAEIKMIYAGAGYPDIDTDDLIINKQGIARMYLYSFEYEASGHLFSNVQAKFYQFGNGVAERARIMDGEGLWNGRKVSDLFYYNADRFKKGTHAQYAELGKGLGKTGVWLVNDDQLQLKKKTDETDVRSLLCVTKRAIIIDPPVGDLKNNGPIPVIRENTTQKFYFEGLTNPVPNNAMVVGIIITGRAQLFHYHSWEIFNWDLSWWGVKAATFFSRHGFRQCDSINSKGEYGGFYSSRFWYLPDHEIHIKPIGWASEPRVEGLQGVNLLDPYELTLDADKWPSLINKFSDLKTHDSLSWEPYNHGYSSGSDHNGYDTWREGWSSSQGFAGILKFKDTNTNRPYIEITMNDNWALSCYLEVRILYIKGEDRKGKEQTTYPWASLNPSLEGGQQ